MKSEQLSTQQFHKKRCLNWEVPATPSESCSIQNLSLAKDMGGYYINGQLKHVHVPNKTQWKVTSVLPAKDLYYGVKVYCPMLGTFFCCQLMQQRPIQTAYVRKCSKTWLFFWSFCKLAIIKFQKNFDRNSTFWGEERLC